jgi:hypothetical protein
MAHLTREQYDAIVAREIAACAALATKWGVEAIGRDYPAQVIRANGYRLVRAGKWYVVRAGERSPATASQARALNSTGVAHGVESVGPIAATEP